MTLTLELVGRGPVAVPPWREARLAWRDAALAACVVLGSGSPLDEVRRWTVGRLREAATAVRGTRLEGVARLALLYARDHLARRGPDDVLFPSAKRDAFGRVAPVRYGHAWRVAGEVVRTLLGVGRVERPLDLLRGLASRLADASPAELPPELEGFDDGVVEGWEAPERRPAPRRAAEPAPEPSGGTGYAEVSLVGPPPEGFEGLEGPARRFCRVVSEAVGAPRLVGADGRFTFDRESYHRRFLRSEKVVRALEGAWLTWSSGKRLDPQRPPWGCFGGEEGEPFGPELAEWYSAYGDSL